MECNTTFTTGSLNCNNTTSNSSICNRCEETNEESFGNIYVNILLQVNNCNYDSLLLTKLSTPLDTCGTKIIECVHFIRHLTSTYYLNNIINKDNYKLYLTDEIPIILDEELTSQYSFLNDIYVKFGFSKRTMSSCVNEYRLFMKVNDFIFYEKIRCGSSKNVIKQGNIAKLPIPTYFQTIEVRFYDL